MVLPLPEPQSPEQARQEQSPPSVGLVVVVGAVVVMNRPGGVEGAHDAQLSTCTVI